MNHKELWVAYRLSLDEQREWLRQEWESKRLVREKKCHDGDEVPDEGKNCIDGMIK